MEVAFLDAHEAATAPNHSVLDAGGFLAVLVVAAEADFRRYVRECLRERPELRLVQAGSVTAAVALAAHHQPALLIVDEPERDIVALLFPLRAIVIVDDATPCVTVDDRTAEIARAEQRVRLVARPFTAEALMREVRQLLG